MTSAAYPTVVTALVSTATTALASQIAAGTMRVVRGYDLSADTSDVMMIGVPSLTSTSSISAGSFTQGVATMGTPRKRDETGSINGIVMARNGQGDQAAACTAAFGYFAALEAAIRTDPTLGVNTFGRLVVGVNSGDVLEDQVNGATTALSFTITYAARI